MVNLPRVRWMALVMAVAFGVVWAGVGWDLGAAIGHLGTKAAAIGAALLSVAKMIEQAMNVIDEEDPMVYTANGRSVEPGGFWRRVL